METGRCVFRVPSLRHVHPEHERAVEVLILPLRRAVDEEELSCEGVALPQPKPCRSRFDRL